MAILHNQNNCGSSLIRSEQERGILIMTTDKEYELNGLLTEEECYQKKIIETVKNVKRKDILIYIFNNVEDIAKEDRTK